MRCRGLICNGTWLANLAGSVLAGHVAIRPLPPSRNAESMARNAGKETLLGRLLPARP